MIANQALGRSFMGLGSYLLTGKDRIDPSQRVGWIEYRNLPTERLDIAIRIMAGTASLSYTKQPVFHLSISFAPGDPVDEALMKRVMVRTLSDLGLSEHQAVMLAHIDTDDPHVHAMVNRVHPDTGVAWKGSWSRLRAEVSLRQQEMDEGLRVVPGWLARVPGHPELRPRPRLVRGDEEFLREVQERATPMLERARSWAELESGLAEFGFSVRVNGRGMSVTDGRREVKASEVGRQFSRGHLEKRLGRYSDYRARVAVAGAPPVLDAGGASPAPARIESPAHPESGAAAGVERVDRALAVEPPSHATPSPAQAPAKQQDAPPTRRAGFLSEVQEKARPVLRLADSWADLEHGLGELGLSLRVKGGGFVVTDGQQEVKASEVGREFSRFYLEKRLGRYPEPQTVAAAEIAPAPPTPAVQPDIPAQHVALPERQAPAAAPQEPEELPVEARFTLYEDEGIFGVYDSAGPQVFFAETRERALKEVARANEIVALYPKTISMRHLREMDGAWRDARRLPRLPEPEGSRISVPWPISVPAEANPASVAQAGIPPADETSVPAPVVEHAAEQVGAMEPPPPAEPIREEVVIQHHGPKPETHRTLDYSAHERGCDAGWDAPDQGRLDLPRCLEGAQEDPAVEEAVRAFAALEDARATAALARALREERNQAEQVLAALNQQDGTLARTKRDFKATAEAVYRDPAAAMAAWDRLVHSERGNLESAAERVREDPEILGPLLTEPHSSVWGLAAAKLGFVSTRMAKEAVPQMLHRAVLYTPALREATKPVEWTAPDGETVYGRAEVRSRANTVALDRRAKIEGAEERIRELGGISGAEREVQRAFAHLSPAQRSQAARRITAWGPAKGITEAAVAANLAEVLGKAHRAARVARSLGEGPGSL